MNRAERMYRVEIIPGENSRIAHFATKQHTIDFLLNDLAKNLDKIESQKTHGIDGDEMTYILNDIEYFYRLCDYLNENER